MCEGDVLGGGTEPLTAPHRRVQPDSGAPLLPAAEPEHVAASGPDAGTLQLMILWLLIRAGNHF